jgi:hypothetical protein
MSPGPDRRERRRTRWMQPRLVASTRAHLDRARRERAPFALQRRAVVAVQSLPRREEQRPRRVDLLQQIRRCLGLIPGARYAHHIRWQRGGRRLTYGFTIAFGDDDARCERT